MRILPSLHAVALALFAQAFVDPANTEEGAPRVGVNFSVESNEWSITYKIGVSAEVRRGKSAYGSVEFRIAPDTTAGGHKAEWELNYPGVEAPGGAIVGATVTYWYEALKRAADAYLAGLSVHGGNGGVLPGPDSNAEGPVEAGAENKS